MLLSLSIIAPIFGLILIGYLAGRFGILPSSAGKGIADFTFILAIPALLFRTIVHADFADADIAGTWGSFFIAAGASWLLSSLVALFVLGRTAREAPAISMAAVFGNTVMLGLPLAVATYGPSATTTIALVLAIHAPTLWLTGTLHQAFADARAGTGGLPAPKALADELLHNPIIIGIAAGLAWRVSGLPLTDPIDEIVELLSQAGIPTALIALGLSLTGFRIKGQGPTLALVCLTKLTLMPAIAWLLATYVFGLAPVPAGIVTILAAMPTGANAYLFAQRHGAAVNSSSGAVALGTLMAALTAAAVLTLLGHGG